MNSELDKFSRVTRFSKPYIMLATATNTLLCQINYTIMDPYSSQVRSVYLPPHNYGKQIHFNYLVKEDAVGFTQIWTNQ